MKYIYLLVLMLTIPKFRPRVRYVVSQINMVMTSNEVLKAFWTVIITPFKLVFSLVGAILKSILILILPQGVYSKISFLLKQVYSDIVEKKYNVKLTLKRLILCAEMFVNGRERKKSFGKLNPDKIFYVIRPYYYLTVNDLTMNVSNLMFHYYRNLQHLAYAVEHGWIPVVDWQNYGPFAHGEDYPINGTTNCWEYYWNQPSPYTLDEVYQSKHVILGVQNTRDNIYVPNCAFSTSLENQAKDIAEKCPKYDQLITFNEHTENYIQEKQNKLFPKNSRILGVGIRGTSYGLMRSTSSQSGHPVQPDLKKLIETIGVIMEEWEMDYVYIACELQQVIDTVAAAFPGKTICLDRLRYEKSPVRGDVEKGLDPLYVPGQKYQTNLDYVTEMALLSRCNSLLAAMSSGVRTAIIWNGGSYENMKIMENGLW